jgi:spore germination protein (amino acid permease)
VQVAIISGKSIIPTGEENMFNAKHLMYLISALTIVSVKTYPGLFIRPAGRDTWLAVALATLLITAYAAYLIWICGTKNCYSLSRIYRVALGEIFGNVMLAVFVLSAALNLVECAAVEPSAMHTHFLMHTPQMGFALLMLLVGWFVATRSCQAVVIVAVIGIAGVALSGMNLYYFVAKYKNYDYLFPVMENGFTKEFALTVVKLLGAYGSVVMVLPYISRVADKEKLLKYTVLGMLFVAQNQIVCMMGSIATFSLPWLKSMVYPKLLQTQLVSHFDFMEAGELFVMYQVVGGWVLKYILCLYAARVVAGSFGVKKRYLCGVMSVFVFFAAQYFAQNLFQLFDVLNYYLYLSLIGQIIVPLLVFTVFLFRCKDKARVGSCPSEQTSEYK